MKKLSILCVMMVFVSGCSSYIILDTKPPDRLVVLEDFKHKIVIKVPAELCDEKLIGQIRIIHIYEDNFPHHSRRSISKHYNNQISFDKHILERRWPKRN